MGQWNVSQKTTELRRRLAAVTPEDKPTSGRPSLFGYGLGYIVRISGRSRGTVRNNASSVPFRDPVEAVAWAVKSRGRPDLADELLELLGYGRKYTAK